MRYWYDTEFIEDGSTVDFISIGIVCEDGREYYAQSSESYPFNANDWVKEHVFPHLLICLPGGDTEIADNMHYGAGKCRDEHCPWRSYAELQKDILSFMAPDIYGKPELWGYYSAYDHVAFCQLFGTMVDLPKGFPMYTRDIKQWCDCLGNPPLPLLGKDEHNALADARWNKQVWEFLRQIEKQRAKR